MPPHTVSHDLKAQIPVLFHEQHFPVDQICNIVGVKKSLVYKTLQYFQVYGIAYNPHAHKSGCCQILSLLDIKFVAALVEQRHCIYLDEIWQALSEQWNCEVLVPTLSCTLQHLDFSQKCVSVWAFECNEILCAAYMNHIADIITNPDMLMFVDESARNRNSSGRKQGWAFMGWHCIQHQFFVLILDNCNIHHSEKVQALVEDEAMCKLIFLPPYSLDLNPIEQAFFSIKSHLQQHWNNFSLSIIDTACHNITADMAWNFIWASGYVI